MSFHLHTEIEFIKRDILSLGAVVEQNLISAVKALEKKDVRLAAQVIDNDDRIDALEVELEETCLKVLALHQPVAIDLRYIIAILKINSDLERIGDLTTTIAESAKILAGQEEIRLPEHFLAMAEKAKRMLRDSLDALIHLDEAKALLVIEADHWIDEQHQRTYKLVEERIIANPQQTGQLITLIGISRSFERIADHATNIAEDVVYMARGEIIRHQPDDVKSMF